ncbi:DUF4166 domain-containing protein [Yoonia sp. BS5-3]|uniref:SDR family oxidoreductase n=1 Tax=Yoonia phaeophyticola TaxID=3137369 RepID=A0ABZ2V9X0_9RHOB
MKAVILGGYGVFGERLARLLLRDGHEVIVAGRTANKAEALAQELGASALVVDRTGPLDALWAEKPDVLIDAAGAFHAYGDDPYGLPKQCIAHGLHYLDLADDPAFCAGIAELDKSAKDAGVFVLSGVSSVPAISSAAVAALAQDMREIDTISTAILPGNRAPRGRSVVASILHQCGRPFDVQIDGVACPHRSWSEPERFDLGGGLIRQGWMIEVPDHRLFAPYFKARSVFFRAGLELGVMNYGLGVLSSLRRYSGFGIAPWFVGLMVRMAQLLWPFGSDRGGMYVSVTGRGATGWERKEWCLVAEAGDGPFIPAVAARAILRQPEAINTGARPALATLPLARIEAAMADLQVTTRMVDHPMTPLFPRQLKDQFAQLPPSVQQAHAVYGPRRWSGKARVSRGASLWARMLARLFGFPPADENVPVTVAMIPQRDGELWERQFGGRLFRSFLREKDGKMTERFGPFTFRLGLHVSGGQLHFPVEAGRLGPLPIPRFCLPQSVACEYEQDGRFHFDVALKAPITCGLIVHYQGWLERAATATQDKMSSDSPSLSISDRNEEAV